MCKGDGREWRSSFVDSSLRGAASLWPLRSCSCDGRLSTEGAHVRQTNATDTTAAGTHTRIKNSLCLTTRTCWRDWISSACLVGQMYPNYIFQRKQPVRFRVPPSGTTCLSTSHLRCHSRFSDNVSRPFCFPVPTKTLSHDSCVTITIRHYCLDTCGPYNNQHQRVASKLAHFLYA